MNESEKQFSLTHRSVEYMRARKKQIPISAMLEGNRLVFDGPDRLHFLARRGIVFLRVEAFP